MCVNRELGRNIRFNRNDWNPKIADNIQNSLPERTGYQKMTNVKVNGKIQKTELSEPY
jgi:hypothetical protein